MYELTRLSQCLSIVSSESTVKGTGLEKLTVKEDSVELNYTDGAKARMCAVEDV